MAQVGMMGSTGRLEEPALFVSPVIAEARGPTFDGVYDDGWGLGRRPFPKLRKGKTTQGQGLRPKHPRHL